MSSDGRVQVTASSGTVQVAEEPAGGEVLRAVVLSAAGDFGTAVVTLSASAPATGYVCIVQIEPSGEDNLSRCVGPDDLSFEQRSAATREVTLSLPVSHPSRLELVAFEQGDLRLAGSTRLETAVHASVHGWEGAETVLLASAGAFPDALAAAPLAATLDAPLLLAGADGLAPDVLAELTRLGPERIVLVGGEAALPAVVAAQAAAVGARVERIAGAERLETARLVAAEVGTPPEGLAVLASGRSFADALVVGPVAGARGLPLYLTEPGGISAATLDALRAEGVRRVLLIGGEQAVAPAVVAELEAAGIAIEARLAGADRYATAAAVVDYALASGASLREVLVATGADFPDALAAGALGARTERLVLLVDPGGPIAAQPATRLLEESGGADLLVVLGGQRAVPTSARAELALTAVGAR